MCMVIDNDFPEVHSVTLIERLNVISQETQARPQTAIVNLFSTGTSIIVD